MVRPLPPQCSQVIRVVDVFPSRESQELQCEKVRRKIILFYLGCTSFFLKGGGGEGRDECDCESKYSANLPVPDKLMHTATAEKKFTHLNRAEKMILHDKKNMMHTHVQRKIKCHKGQTFNA